MSYKINWEWLTQAYNEEKGTNYSSPKEMRRDLYEKKKLTAKKIDRILGVGYTVISNKLKEDRIKMRRRGDYAGAKDTAFLEIPEQEMKNMTISDLEIEINCSTSSVFRLLKKHKKVYKKYQKIREK